MPVRISKGASLKFIVALGFVSLFCDLTHEGARSIAGPFLAVLGASGTVVGIVAGFGELVGYVLRLATGYLSDKTGRYWTFMTVGYVLNVAAPPLLALAGSWELAAFLMIAERTGRAIRHPARDTVLAGVAKEVGVGWGFGLHEAMDSIGALLGPLAVAAVLYFNGNYRTAFFALLIPAVLTLTFFLLARMTYPLSRAAGPQREKLENDGFPDVFWLYVAAVCSIGMGYADFPLIAYHFKKTAVVEQELIPIFYAVAMGVSALAAVTFGRLYDRIGFPVLIMSALLSSLFAPLVFLGGLGPALTGMILWGIGIGAQESIMRSAIVNLVPSPRLGFAYGVLNSGYGIFWFFGSAIMGMLYDTSMETLIIFSVGAQLISIPMLLLAKKELTSASG
ncbi:MAG: MFS transporter [Desulfomonile sp.]|nr:MFS transporter [Desulfomonile sp.]